MPHSRGQLAVQEPEELLHVQLRIPPKLPKESGLQRAMVRIRWGPFLGVPWVAKADMASSLPDHFITEALEDADGFLSGHDRKLRAHCVTTTLPMRTPDGSGIFSPVACISSRHNAMASRTLLNASSTVSPWVWQPGSEGHVTTYPPVSSGSKITLKS